MTMLDFANQAELPFAECDTVVVGEVVNAQPFLSADGKGLYTEFLLKITDAAKSTAPIAAYTGQSVTLLRQGGAALAADHRVLQHHIRNDIKPLVGKQYIAFLVYAKGLEAFYYTKLWLIEDNVVKPLFPDDIAREKAGNSTSAGRPLPDVMTALRSAIGR